MWRLGFTIGKSRWRCTTICMGIYTEQPQLENLCTHIGKTRRAQGEKEQECLGERPISDALMYVDERLAIG